MSDHTRILNSHYNSALKKLDSNNSIPEPVNRLTSDEVTLLDFIANNSEYFKGATTVLITSFVHKEVNPSQDVRRHQSNMQKGYSGRSVDTKYVTPFLKEKKLTHMEESGWLTRSLEQNYPYDFNYNGKIRNRELRNAFLTLLDNIETKGAKPEDYLDYLLQKLIVLRNSGIVEVEKFIDAGNSIDDIVSMLDEHFSRSGSAGTSRLPVLAVFSIYQCIVPQLRRYEGKNLKKLESHTSPDSRSGDIGDIQVNGDTTPFEGVEVKYGIKITPQLIDDAYRKFLRYPVDRYYILSTIEPTEVERSEINKMTEKIAQEHGCQFIADGLLDTIKYYLRLIEDTEDFLNNYSVNLANDEVIKTDHKKLWKSIVKQKLNTLGIIE